MLTLLVLPEKSPVCVHERHWNIGFQLQDGLPYCTGQLGSCTVLTPDPFKSGNLDTQKISLDLMDPGGRE